MGHPPSQARLSTIAPWSAALYSVLVGGAVLLAGWLIGAGNRDRALANREDDLGHRARTIQVRIETEIRAVSNDVRFLAEAPFLRDIADVGDPESVPENLVSRAEESLAALLTGKPSYAQSRLLHLSEPGRELIRIDQHEGEVTPVPPDQLQPKGHRDYFRESAKLAEGEIYLSPINLNREFGQISTPKMPTLRVATKVFDREKNPFGLVVINVDLRPLFAELKALAGSGASLYIANAEGDYLVHPDTAKTFGFDLGARHRLSDTFGPDPVSSPQGSREVIRFVRSEIPPAAGRELLIGVGTPRAALLSELARIRKRSLATALAAALLAAALVWSLAAKVDRQVAALDRARQVAEENRRAKEEFLANLSHEIRTPMNAVTGLVHALATDRPAEHQGATLSSLQFASRKLIAVVNDVLDFSKIEAGEITFRRAPFDLRDLLDNIRTGNAPQAQEAEVELSMTCGPTVPRFLVGDSLRLYQILNNLIQNAVKFTPPGGGVAVDVSLGEGSAPDCAQILFRVEDTGIGMNSADLALARYGQAKSEQSFSGTGLGLPISKELVEMQGGRFDAHSTPGAGSVFRFELAFGIPEDDAELPKTDLGVVHDLRGARILCIEDVASNRLVVSALLDPTGTELSFAEDAAATLALLSSTDSPPDLILLDLQLPDRDGASLATDLRKNWPDIPVIGLTAQTSGELLERCQRAGVTSFLWKPIDPESFYKKIGEAIAPARSGESTSAGRDIDASPVYALFDGDAEKARRYLETLATELDDSVEALATLAATQDSAGARQMHHRLTNGLSLVGASAALDQLSAFANAVESQTRLDDCRRSFTNIATELRRPDSEQADLLPQNPKTS